MHTHGPWRTGDRFNTVFGPPNGQPCPAVIATVQKGNKANARLIAAAPELLAALQRIAAGDAGNPEFAALAISEARGAIAKTI